MGKEIKVEINYDEIRVSGSTYLVQGTLKKYGLKWNKEDKVWVGSTIGYQNLIEELQKKGFEVKVVQKSDVVLDYSDILDWGK